MSDYADDFDSPTKTDASPAASPEASPKKESPPPAAAAPEKAKETTAEEPAAAPAPSPKEEDAEKKDAAAPASSSSDKTLHVKVLRARKVSTASDVNLPDPYCAVLVGDQRFQTAAVDSTTEPVWNATFEFRVADPATDALTVRLWEEDTFADDKLGDAKIALSDASIVDGEWVAKTVAIGKEGCEIDVELKAVGFGAAAKQEKEEAEAASEPASPAKESSVARSPTPPSSHRSLTPTPRSSANSSPAASPTKSEKKDEPAAAAADPAPEEDAKKEREETAKEDDSAASASKDADADADADAAADDDEEGAAAANDDAAKNDSQNQSKIAQRKRLPPRSGGVATVSYPGERQVAVADILDPTKPLVKSTKPLTRPLGPSFVEESTAEERRQRRLRQKSSSTERTGAISEQRDNERRYLKAQQEFEREKRLAERAIYHRERVSQWATRLGASPLGVDLVADHERIDEEAFVRQREEKRRQALAEKRKRRIKNEIIVKALAEVPLLEEARRQKREMLEEERREKAQRDVQRVEAIQARKLRDMALMKEERQSKLDQRLMNA